ncbi:MAG: fumarylacetoacetase [Bernardetiaceae bacterium]|nr:fumarylacetoacetase [Bernardetiaceae bacterium]
MAETHDPNLETFVSIPENSDFPIQNLPYGIFSKSDADKAVGVRIGDHVLDLSKLYKDKHLDGIGIHDNVFDRAYLNDFMEMGKNYWQKTRLRISRLLRKGSAIEAEAKRYLYPISSLEVHLPVFVRDYTDFYSSEEHATNVGKMFRPNGDPLLPNWKHLPVGYHGRASSIIVSGTDIHRPKGQTKPKEDEPPVFGPSQRMDFELEMAFITGTASELGEAITTQEAENHIFGMVLFNDWSARDLQKWEYVPLGPFLGKNFASSISPWIVTLDALEPFRTASPKQDPEVLPYLKCNANHAFDINLQVYLQPEAGKENLICRSNFKHMYWNIAQQLAHHTVNGCNIGVGDMYGSGTISGKTEDSFGSMLELSWAGTKPLKLNDGSERKFLQDNDTVIMRGYAQKDGLRIGFGEVRTKLLPTK